MIVEDELLAQTNAPYKKSTLPIGRSQTHINTNVSTHLHCKNDMTTVQNHTGDVEQGDNTRILRGICLSKVEPCVSLDNE